MGIVFFFNTCGFLHTVVKFFSPIGKSDILENAVNESQDSVEILN